MPGGMLECKRSKQMFYLVRLDRDADNNLVETPLPDYGTFEKGADAAKASKAAAGQLGAKVQCRRIAQAGDWRSTIQQKFDDGKLKPLPAGWTLPPIKDHFAHVEDIFIRFIESEEHGIIQKFTMLTAGRYISRFHETNGKMDDSERRRLIATIDPSDEVHFATTPEDIEYVYRNGPESCMDGKDGNVRNFCSLPMWPTSPYGAGDLAVAYTKNRQGRIQSRAVCWPEKKLLGRIFGDYDRMLKVMVAEGYDYIRDDNRAVGNRKAGVFIGAKLLKVPTGKKDDQFVVPYFDDIKVAIDMGDHFLTAEQGEAGKRWVASGSSSSGTSMLMGLCQKTNAPVEAKGIQFVHGVDEEWGIDAVRNHAFCCDRSKKYWPHEYKVVIGSGRETWSKEEFAEHGEYCLITRKNWPKDEMVQLGELRVHQSECHRFNDKGEELAVEPKPRTGQRKRAFADLQSMVDVNGLDWARVETTDLVLRRRVA
jgi:hypothetical protein